MKVRKLRTLTERMLLRRNRRERNKAFQDFAITGTGLVYSRKSKAHDVEIIEYVPIEDGVLVG